jgi:hypothetical protein
MLISLRSEDVSVFQRIYAEKSETVDWMLNFGCPIEKMIAGLIKEAKEGKAGVWSLSAGNTWRPGIYL